MCAYALTFFFFTGCAAAEDPSLIKHSTDEPVSFFTEEATVEKTLTVSAVYDSEDIHFDDTYILREAGASYELILQDVKIEPATISGRSVPVEYTVIYGEGEDIPKTVKVTYMDDGAVPPTETVKLTESIGKTDETGTSESLQEDASDEKTAQNGSESVTFTPVFGELELKSTKPGEPYWKGDLVLNVTYQDWGSAYYAFADIYIPHSDDAPVLDGFEDAYLMHLGLPYDSYSLSSSAWAGDPYESNGTLCRDGLLYGSRLVRGTVAVYEGTITLPDVQGYKGTATYMYRGIVRNAKRVRNVTLAGIAVFAVLVTALLFLFAKKKRKRKETPQI